MKRLFFTLAFTLSSLPVFAANHPFFKLKCQVKVEQRQRYKNSELSRPKFNYKTFNFNQLNILQKESYHYAGGEVNQDHDFLIRFDKIEDKIGREFNISLKLKRESRWSVGAGTTDRIVIYTLKDDWKLSFTTPIIIMTRHESEENFSVKTEGLNFKSVNLIDEELGKLFVTTKCHKAIVLE